MAEVRHLRDERGIGFAAQLRGVKRRAQIGAASRFERRGFDGAEGTVGGEGVADLGMERQRHAHRRGQNEQNENRMAFHKQERAAKTARQSARQRHNDTRQCKLEHEPIWPMPAASLAQPGVFLTRPGLLAEEEKPLTFRSFQNKADMTTETRPPLPPFTIETARQKVRAAQDAWNTRDPERVASAYTPDSQWRNRDEFFEGPAAIVAFLARKWERELDYRLVKQLWGFRENRMAVRFFYEWHDAAGEWHRSHGNELWEFDPSGLMRRREASINDLPIDETERLLRDDAAPREWNDNDWWDLPRPSRGA